MVDPKRLAGARITMSEKPGMLATDVAGVAEIANLAMEFYAGHDAIEDCEPAPLRMPAGIRGRVTRGLRSQRRFTQPISDLDKLFADKAMGKIVREELAADTAVGGEDAMIEEIEREDEEADEETTEEDSIYADDDFEDDRDNRSYSIIVQYCAGGTVSVSDVESSEPFYIEKDRYGEITTYEPKQRVKTNVIANNRFFMVVDDNSVVIDEPIGITLVGGHTGIRAYQSHRRFVGEDRFHFPNNSKRYVPHIEHRRRVANA